MQGCYGPLGEPDIALHEAISTRVWIFLADDFICHLRRWRTRRKPTLCLTNRIIFRHACAVCPPVDGADSIETESPDMASRPRICFQAPGSSGSLSDGPGALHDVPADRIELAASSTVGGQPRPLAREGGWRVKEDADGDTAVAEPHDFNIRYNGRHVPSHPRTETWVEHRSVVVYVSYRRALTVV